MSNFLNKTTPISPMRGSISTQSVICCPPPSSKLKERPSLNGSSLAVKNTMGLVPSGNFGFNLPTTPKSNNQGLYY